MIAATNNKYVHLTQPGMFMVVALLYFFVNGLFLPQGLLYTTLLTPILLLWTIRGGYRMPYAVFFAISIPYMLYHYTLNIDVGFYFRSLVMAFCSVVFAVAVHNFLRTVKHPERIFKSILLINAFLIPVALWSLLMPPINQLFWYYQPISPGITAFPRLQMMTYEASYYSFLFAPIWIYYTLRILSGDIKNKLLIAVLIFVPMTLSLSFGVIALFMAVIAVIFFISFNTIINTRKKLFWLFAGAFTSIVLLLVIYKLFPHNPIYTRIDNILNAKDTSSRGRTKEALQIAYKVTQAKNSFWLGVGLGQIKIIAREIILKYYSYYQPGKWVRIPNSMAETFAMYGVIAFYLRIAVEFFLFFKTKVYTNQFRLAIFLFVFIYSFTGSFMFNIVEWVFWVIAFSPFAFKQFTYAKYKQPVTK